METKNLGTVGLIGRFKPLHVGHTAMLVATCQAAETVIIGLGSSNIHDVRNPFSANESRAMIDRVLKGRFTNYRFIEVPDVGNEQRWREQVQLLFGDLDHFVTANAYVRSLLEGVYTIVHPLALLDYEEHVPVSGTMVRVALARGDPWEHLVPSPVVSYMKEHQLHVRFRDEFGPATLAGTMDMDCVVQENNKRSNSTRSKRHSRSDSLHRELRLE